MRLVQRVFPFILLGALLAFLVMWSSASLTNYDTFFHLRIGEHFLTDWTPWNPGHFNRYATADWLPTQWLSEVWMAWTARHFGLAGVAWLAGSWMLGLAIAVYAVCRRQGPPLVAAVVAIFVVIASAAGLSARPQVLSYLLMSVVVGAWLACAESGRLPYWLIPLTWLWTMLHGMWLPGLVTSAVCAATLAFSSIGQRQRRGLLVIPAVSALVPLVTPMGLGLDLYRAVAAVGANSSNVGEWAPAHYTDPRNACLALMLAAAIALMLSRRVRPIDGALLLLALAWALYSQRTVPLAAVTVAPILARYLATYTNSGFRFRREFVVVTGLALACLVGLGFTASNAAKIHQPRWVAPALSSLPPGTGVLAEDAVSGYLVWAYPNLAPVATGYFDMYSAEHAKIYHRVFTLRPGWARGVTNWDTQVALLSPKTPLFAALVDQEHWSVVHRSADIALLRAPGRPADGG